MHFGVEIVPDQAGAQFKRWIGGFYENMFSCNPIWEPQFSQFPNHPITRGVKPFQSKDEWYFNMRFVKDVSGNAPADLEGTKFVPILVASPSDDVRDGPYVYPPGPYRHIEANTGRAEAMMWSVERPDGGRGFGFTGGHFHDNWGNDSYRKVVLNALLWSAHAEVPANGVEPQRPLSIPRQKLSVLRSNGVWLPQLGRVVANEILSTNKRKGWCRNDTSLFVLSLFVVRRPFDPFEIVSLRLSLPQNLSTA
jgi:hypothetical protein